MMQITAFDMQSCKHGAAGKTHLFLPIGATAPAPRVTARSRCRPQTRPHGAAEGFLHHACAAELGRCQALDMDRL